MSSGREGTAARAFQLVKAVEWLNEKGSWDNSYEGTFGRNGWGWKAQEVLGKVRALLGRGGGAAWQGGQAWGAGWGSGLALAPMPNAHVPGLAGGLQGHRLLSASATACWRRAMRSGPSSPRQAGMRAR